MNSYLQALNAYRETVSRPLDAGGAQTAAGAAGPSFSEVLQTATSQAVETAQQAERVSADALVGKADLTDVVNAITQAELTLQGVVAVRDRVVSAYQEVMRMQM